MLGEKLGGETGKVTSQRVLANPGGAPKMETSFRPPDAPRGKRDQRRHVLGGRSPGRYVVRRRTRRCDGQRRRNGLVGGKA